MANAGHEPRISFYGRTYLDIEVQVPLSALSESKSKVDAEVSAVHGGFACNAARALGERFGPGEVRVVTATSPVGWPLLRDSLPAGIGLDALVTAGGNALPPVSVIIDPARACRIFRNRSEHDAAQWQVEKVPSGALAARLHVLGRLPPRFAAQVLERARSAGARFAWCGGDSLPLELERECDLMCVNKAEAGRLIGAIGSTPRQLAEALAARACIPDAVRVVTGGGQSATAAAFRAGRSIGCREAAAALVPPERITRLLGVGDAFAAHFVVAACFDSKGALRRRLEVFKALAAAQEVAGRFITLAKRRSGAAKSPR